MDNPRIFDTLPPTMKSDTLNAVLTCLLGILVVLGVVFALRLVAITKDTRQLQQMAVAAKVNLARAQGLFAAAQEYNQKYPSTELTRILQAVQPNQSTPRSR